MEEIKLGVVEARFADIIWQNEPLTSRQLVEICETELNWKRTTTYTVLKKLCEKGLFKHEEKLISSLISKKEFYSLKSERFVEETFAGSLPAFLAAFTSRKKLSDDEIDEIKKMIEAYKEDK